MLRPLPETNCEGVRLPVRRCFRIAPQARIQRNLADTLGEPIHTAWNAHLSRVVSGPRVSPAACGFADRRALRRPHRCTREAASRGVVRIAWNGGPAGRVPILL